jgi:enamine deaminase RidA (YjgF/YER057c/UK114 family)
MKAEEKLRAMGITLPDFTKRAFIGASHGKMRPYRIHNGVLYLAGHVPDVDGKPFSPGRLGDTLTTEQGYAAARVAAINVLAGVKQALGDLDRVAFVLRTLNFVISTPDYHEPHLVANGVTDLFAELWGPENGVGARATIGAQALTNNYCFETWCEFGLM